MNTRNQKDPKDHVANLSKRARLASLLFDGARLGTTLPSPAAFVEVPKLPPGASE